MMRSAIWSWVFAFSTLTWMFGCSGAAPLAPTRVATELGGSTALATASTIGTPSVTMQPDLTASPSRITIAAGSRVLFTNRSGRSTRLHSYNCSEFSLMALPDGYSKNTYPFSPAGKTCDYFAWDTNWSRKIFVGQVVVE